MDAQMVMSVDRQVRCEQRCRGCGRDKGENHGGLVVCWTCFKYRSDGKDYKYFNGLWMEDRWEDFVSHMNRWLEHIGKAKNKLVVVDGELQPF